MSALLATNSFWMPEQASSYAGDVDWLFYFIYYVSLFFFILVAGLMFIFMIIYRRRSEEQPVGHITHSMTLEVVWTVIPTILLVFMFWWGFEGFMDMRTPAEGAYEVKVKAQKWSWTFIYPNGVDDSELHLPVNRPIRLVMFSEDVLHSCYIPAFRAKRDVVPGRYADLMFTPIKEGVFPLLCAEYCGTNHSNMRATVHVHDAAGFEEYLKTADPFYQMTPEEYTEYQKDPSKFIETHKEDPRFKRLKAPLEMGKELYDKKGCKQCHSLDGASGNGPTWKGVYGHKVDFRDGTSIEKADENYIRESILEPKAKIVAGFQDVMPKVKLSDRQIDTLIDFIKSLKD